MSFLQELVMLAIVINEFHTDPDNPTGVGGVIQSEVVLISRKDYGDDRRWVYLDVGKFSGLAETMDEAIKYRIRTPRDGGPPR